MIRTIFLDLDDVLNTLAPCALNAVGCPVAPDSYDGYPGEFGFNVQDVANDMLGTEYTWKSFWEDIPQNVWATIPRSDFFDWLLETCRSLVGEKDVFLATSPTYEPYCAAGKMEWIQKYCPLWLQRQFFITPCKSRLGRIDALLIDDLFENIQQFREEGGSAIMVPRPWNPLGGTDPKTHITACLKQFHFTSGELV